MTELSDVIKQQKERLRNAPVGSQPSQQPSPYFGKNPFEPSSYIPFISSNPSLGEPLPSGRFVDPNIPSDVNTVRMQQTQDMMTDPEKYLKEHGTQAVNEQSLIDKGKSMLSRIFDYQDDADAQLFGMNVSAAESVWDGFIAHFTGFYDLLSVGFGGLISAAPGGMRTLSYDELSAGKSVGQILNGEMDREAAPSPGQIFVASMGEAAGRVRRGEARLSDIIAMAGPIGFAALAAESSPLQQENFDIMNKEQRDKAFSQGWEHWMSGVTDFGLAFADPLIGAGVAGKIMRAGMLGAVGPAKLGARFATYSDRALSELSEAAGMGQKGLQDEAMQLAQYGDQTASFEVRDVYKGTQPPPTAPLRSFTTADAMPTKFNSPLAQFFYDVTVRDSNTGAKIMPLEKVMERPEINALANRAEVAELLHRTDSPVVAAALIGDLHGAPGARQLLERIAPATADTTYRMRFLELSSKRSTEPAKVADAITGMERVIENLSSQREWLVKRIASMGPEADTQALTTRLRTYDQSIDEGNALIDSVRNNTPIDRMNPQSPFFNMDYTDAVMRDLHRQGDVVTLALNKHLSETAAQAKMLFPMADNPYARMVGRSRARRQKAAYEYKIEGTNILPKKVVTSATEGGKVKTEWQFWSASQFEGTSRLQRNARVWRWMGSGTPSGFISLKGTSLVNQDREMSAVLDLDLYKGEPIKAMRLARTRDGSVLHDLDTGQAKFEQIEVGGQARRDALMQKFTESIVDPDKDPLVAIMEIEKEIMSDMAAAYGLSQKHAEDLLLKANKGREGVLDMVRQRGFYIDPVDGERHYNPYLDSQLANGTYMHNFQAIETIMRRESLRDGGKRIREWLDGAGAVTGGIYDTFNSIWRPATLLRMGYTQRNVIEGMVRAMAFNASAAPLLWPVKATAYGIRNKTVGKAVASRVAKAKKALEGTPIDKLRRDYEQSMMNRMRYEQAFEGDIPKSMGGKPGDRAMWISTGPGGRQTAFEMISEGDLRKGLADARVKEEAAKQALEANPDALVSALSGTEAGTFIKKQIEGLEKAISEHQARMDQIREMIGEVDAMGRPITIEDVGKHLRELQDLMEIDVARLARMRFDPVAALNEYQAAAGRAKRIGSGTSIGPDGGIYNNAFEGPYEQIARGNLSADSTVKQAMALHADVLGSLWRRMSLRTNAPVAWNAADPREWIAGMRGVIETNSSSALVRELVKNDFDLDRTLQWLVADPEGSKWYRAVQTMQGSEAAQVTHLNSVAERQYGMTTAKGRAASNQAKRRVAGKQGYVRVDTGMRNERMPRIGEVLTAADDTKIVTFADMDQARQFLVDVQQKLMDQMQRQPGFIQLLRQRCLEKSRQGAEKLGDASDKGITSLTDDSIKAVIDALPPNVRDNLGYVQGSELIDMGTKKPMEWWAGATSKLFRLLGTVPEDAIVRGPFYQSRFKAARDDMIEMYLIRTGQANKIRRGVRTTAKNGKKHGGTIEHDEFKIPQEELQRIYYQSHRTALADTREWMYTIERRTKLGKYGEWIYPFISATQNSVVTVGKLLYKQPWLAPFIRDLWQAPERAGFEDDKGNLMMPMPLPFVRDWLADKPGIPVIGGVLSKWDMITVPKNGLNIWIPETGFGPVPRPTPWVQVAASELMKSGMLPVETPQIVKNALGEKNGNDFYSGFKDYIFGEGGAPSDKPFSVDMFLPATWRKVWQSRDELSKQYGIQYQLISATEQARYHAHERDDPPKPEEIAQRATNMMWFQVLGNFGMPTPLTPYPIVTRPEIQSPVQVIQDRLRMYQQENSKDANMNFYNDYGDLALMMGTSKITRNVGGAEPQPEVVSDSQTLAPLIRNVVTRINNPEVLGILVNNRTTDGVYDDSAYAWQETNRIPGSNSEWRVIPGPQQSEAERQRVTGWVEYRQFMDKLDAQLASAGIPNYQVAAARPYKAAKDRFIRSMMENPERDGWQVDYTSQAGPKAVDAVRTMQMAVQDEDFVKLIGEHDPTLLNAMSTYLHYRNVTLQLVEQSGHSLNAPENTHIKNAWLTIRQNLSAQPRFAEIMSMYLYGDEEPDNPGLVGTDRYYIPEGGDNGGKQ